MSLLDVQIGSQVRLSSIQGRGLIAKLTQIGLHEGDYVRVLRAAPLGGPVLIEVNGREIALGRGVAQKITVEAECESR
jgi:ferrous iron transport protein A